ncbi:MAG: ATP-binding cassette domain-containing protein [Anaerolineae bacterium]|nr:ATP-binding cassette domain-containing protein [Anaerolineae bacterium]
MKPFLVCENLVKIFKVANLEVVALQGLNLTVQPGELMGIVGASGSGKSTLLNILGGLDRPSAGRLTVNGRDLLKAADSVLDEYRRTEVGFVWQQTARNLMPYLTAQENVELPMTIEGVPPRDKRAWARELLNVVGLWEHRQHRLAQLSGGQQQRVAIAVALANRPKLLLGDEPTGEVDNATAQEILALFRTMNEQYGLTTIIVTHDPQIARNVDRVVTIRDGSNSSEAVRRVADVEVALTRGAPETAAHAYDEYVMVDAAGRLQLPPNLRSELGIGERVTIERADSGILIRPAALQPIVSPERDRAPSGSDDDAEGTARRSKLSGLLRRVRHPMTGSVGEDTPPGKEKQ